ncbi:MAG: hypothetical protein WC758_02705 [Candidatus Woesearchaeota archaeon]|jgi:hypothetical protein
MSILNLFKKNSKSKPNNKDITLDSLNDWLEYFLENSGIDPKISILKRDISSKVTRLNELLHELEIAKLKDEKIVPERLKSIFEGNKKAFLDRVNLFISELKVPENREEISDFLETLSEKINTLSEDTQKNYFILREFVEDEIRPVTSKLKDIDMLISNSRAEFDKTPLTKIREIRTQHKKYYFLLGEIEKLTKELEHTTNMKNSELDRKNKFDSKLEQLKETKAYDEYKTLQIREKTLKEEVVKTEKEIQDLFSKLEYAIRKKHKTYPNNILEKYSTSPVDALIDDVSLKIISELEIIKEKMDELISKKENQETILLAIDNIQQENLENIRHKLLNLKEEFEIVVNRLKDNHYERSIKERESWIDSINKNIDAIDKKEKDIEDLIERMNPKYVKQKIRDLLRLLDEKVDLK